MSSAPTLVVSLPAELAEYLRQIQEIERDADRLTEGLTDEQFNWRPAPGKWSIAECISHLNVVGWRHLPKFDEAMSRAHRHKLYGSGPFHYGYVGRWMIRSSEPPVKTRMKAPKSAAPLSFRPRRELLREFGELQEEFAERIRLANGLDLARVKVESPFLRMFKFSLGVGFAFLLAHERRHLWQAGQVRDDARFRPTA
jgi:hypothetical protein